MSGLEILALVPLGAWIAVAALCCYGVWDSIQSLKPPRDSGWRPRVTLIIPVRGVPPNFSALWQAICAQKLAANRVIFAVEGDRDGAHAAIQALPPGPPRDCVVAGPTSMRAQKVHNLLAAVATLKPDDEIVVMADADIVPDETWLLRLVVPLQEPGIRVVSGYRWMTPSDQRWSSALVCVANASVATLPRSPRWNIVWGGSSALTRETLEALDLPNWWKDLVLDDIPLSQAIHNRGWHVTAPQSLLVPSPIAWSWSSAFAFGRRQYLLCRWFAPGLWAISAAGTTVPLIGWAVALPLAIGGNAFAIAAIIVANLLDQVRASLRLRVSRILWNQEMPRRMALIDRFGTPASLAFHAAAIWSTLFRYSIDWGGRTYKVDPKGKVLRIDVHPS